MLRDLSDRVPTRQDILGDYAVVLGWGTRDTDALDLLPRIDRPAIAPYVLAGLAGSARRLKRFELAESLYREVIDRPAATAQERLDAQVGLADTLADAGRLFEALVAYQKILAAHPGTRGALRGKVFALERLGAPALAAELADRAPGLVDERERAALAAGSTASRIRWGAIAADTGRGMERFAVLDRALSDSEGAGTRALDPAAALSPVERQLALDRIVALSARFRMQEAIALYLAMAARPEPVPPYVKASTASAFLYLEQPERARDLYREVLAVQPDSLESRLGLFYALAESEDHGAALAQIEQLVADTPPRIDSWSPATSRENPAYARVLSARALAPLYANRPGEAHLRLRDLSERAPFNTDVRASYASSARARGWPRTAEEELRWVLAVEPVNSDALGERAGALLEMREYRAAESALGDAQAIAKESKAVTRSARLSQVHDMRELIVEGNSGRSNGGPFGNRDFALESWLYSAPLAYSYRAYAHLFDAQATYANGTARRERAGVGLEYRSQRFVATGEVSHGLDGSKTGAAASIAYSPDNFWTFRGTLDSSSNATPLQARLIGVDARRALGEVTWRAHESRAASVAAEHFDFTDGNRRDTLQARWTERVISGPVYKLEITGSVYTSRNTLTTAPYFNPVRDFSPTLEFANEWLQWRRYARAFRHRLVVAVGSYAQQGFATGPVSNLRYEQEWDADDRLALRYGIGRSVHPYDGVKSTRDYAYVSLNWKF